MKKIVLMVLSLISFNAFCSSGVTILSTEHYMSPGFNGNLEVKMTERKLTPEELIAMNKNSVYNLGYTLIAAAKNVTGKINQNIPITSQHQSCFVNNTNSVMQYGYRFDLQVMNDSFLDAQTFFLHPGYQICYTRDGFVNFQFGNIGEWRITAITRGAEGNRTEEVQSYATLTVTN